MEEGHCKTSTMVSDLPAHVQLHVHVLVNVHVGMAECQSLHMLL